MSYDVWNMFDEEEKARKKLWILVIKLMTSIAFLLTWAYFGWRTYKITGHSEYGWIVFLAGSYLHDIRDRTQKPQANVV